MSCPTWIDPSSHPQTEKPAAAEIAGGILDFFGDLAPTIDQGDDVLEIVAAQVIQGSPLEHRDAHDPILSFKSFAAS